MVDLSPLREFMNGILESTEDVRRKMQREIDDADFVLEPWIVDTFVSRKVGVDQCTCPQVKSLDEQAEELAVGIDKAIQQSQELRSVLAKHMKEEQRKLSRPTVQQIYGSKLKSKPKLKDCIVENKNLCDKNVEKVEKKNDKPLCLPKIKQKNFIAANKSTVKLMSKNNSKIKIELKSSSSDSGGSLKGKNRFPSVTELDNLLKKITIDKSKNSSTPCLNNFSNDCPRHGENATEIVTEKKKIIIDIVEGLDRFGVPSDLLKIIKLYQSFVTKQSEEKNRRKVNPFLQNLEAFHEQQVSGVSHKDHAHLVKGFNKLHRDLHDHSPEKSKIMFLKNSYNKLDNLSKICEIKKYDTLKNRRSELKETKNSTASGWLSNGFWNPSSIKYFPDMLKLNSLNYSNKNQLLTFFTSTQQLQHRIYQKKLINIILESVIPSIKNYETNSKEYIYIYKMIFTIVQVLNPKMPVLVKTE